MAAQQNTSAFVDRLFAAIPEDKKAEVQSAYSALQDRIRVVDDTHQKQSAWWETNKNAVQERDSLAAKVAELQGAQSKPGEGSGMNQDAITAALRESEARTLETGLGLITAISTISAQHAKEFGEALDARKLAQDAINAGQNIEQYYATLVSPRRTERMNADVQARIDAARLEGQVAGRKEVMDATGRSLPFPSANGSPAVTTLSGLKKPADGQAASPFSLDAAVATAMEVASRQQ